MKKQIKKQSGFTLIELLVVIAILGILATLTLMSLSSAYAKARDAKRLSDVKQMSTLLAMEVTSDPSAELEGCVAADDLTTDCTGPGDIAQFANFEDPSGTTACDGTETAGDTCAYSIAAAGSTVSDAIIQFSLEQNAAGLSAGANTINAEGIFNP